MPKRCPGPRFQDPTGNPLDTVPSQPATLHKEFSHGLPLPHGLSLEPGLLINGQANDDHLRTPDRIRFGGILIYSYFLGSRPVCPFYFVDTLRDPCPALGPNPTRHTNRLRLPTSRSLRLFLCCLVNPVMLPAGPKTPRTTNGEGRGQEQIMNKPGSPTSRACPGRADQ